MFKIVEWFDSLIADEPVFAIALLLLGCRFFILSFLGMLSSVFFAAFYFWVLAEKMAQCSEIDWTIELKCNLNPTCSICFFFCYSRRLKRSSDLMAQDPRVVSAQLTLNFL